MLSPIIILMKKRKSLDLSPELPIMPRTRIHIILDGRSSKYNFADCIMSSVQEYFSHLLQEKGMTVLGRVFHDFCDPK